MAMAKKKTRVGGLQRTDPAVQEWLDAAAENTAALTAKQRWERKRKKTTYDLPAEIIDAVTMVADHEKCSASSVAAVLLYHGLKFAALGGIDFSAYARPSRSPRFENVLEIPEEELAFLEGLDFLSRFLKTQDDSLIADERRRIRLPLT